MEMADNLRRARPQIPAAGMLLALLLAAGPLWAQVADESPAAPATAVANDTTGVASSSYTALPGFQRSPLSSDRAEYDITFRQLGATMPLRLRGVDGRHGVAFSVRADEVVTEARLHLEYSYSPALLPEISQLNILINEQTVDSLAIDPATSGRLQRAVIDIPPALISDFNRADIQLVGHYTLECEDPMHSSLWAVVNNSSSLAFTTQRLPMPNDLGLLPLPFFDRRSVQPLSLPVVFPQAPSTQRLEAAAAVTSWFGALASYRSAQFPATIGNLPPSGHAVILATSDDRLPGVTIPEVAGPTLAITQHPRDRYGKLLWVLGRNSAELNLAARALVLGSQALSGERAAVEGLVELEPRQPYDAPNWLPTHRPVRFGELVSSGDLNVRGYTPDLIRVPLRLPPDLFGWRSRGIPVDLIYRYTPRPVRDQSTLNINVGDSFLRSLPIPASPDASPNALERVFRDITADPTGVGRARFYIPLFMLPSRSELTFHYYYEYLNEGECRSVPLDNVRGAIDPGSTLDISHLPHYLAMPDLAAFATSAFPFTRMADLAETVVVLPDGGNVQDITAFLTLMGRIGDVTGYPAVRVTVSRATEPERWVNKDLLILASGENQPMLTRWADRLPFQVSQGTARFELSDSLWRGLSWLPGARWSGEERRRAELLLSSQGTDALVAGIESPITPRRSVVVLAADDSASLLQAVNAWVDPTTTVAQDLQGSFALIRGDRAETLVAEHHYTMGQLNPLLRLRYFLAHQPLLLVLGSVLGIVLLATFFFLILRARARRRLTP